MEARSQQIGKCLVTMGHALLNLSESVIVTETNGQANSGHDNKAFGLFCTRQVVSIYYMPGLLNHLSANQIPSKLGSVENEADARRHLTGVEP